MLPLAGLVVGVGPGQTEHVGQEPLGQPVATHDGLGERHAGGGECDGVADHDEPLGLHATDHLRHSGPADAEPFRDPDADHVDVVLVELPDRLAVLLEGGVVLP